MNKDLVFYSLMSIGVYCFVLFVILRRWLFKPYDLVKTLLHQWVIWFEMWFVISFVISVAFSFKNLGFLAMAAFWILALFAFDALVVKWKPIIKIYDWIREV